MPHRGLPTLRRTGAGTDPATVRWEIQSVDSWLTKAVRQRAAPVCRWLPQPAASPMAVS
jgi:hypothetical protein